MKNPLSKIPFLFFLIPLIVGILLQYFFKIQSWSVAFFSLGVIAMLFSYLIPEHKQFQWRWLFGLGVFLSLITVGIESTSLKQRQSEFEFAKQKHIYKGVVVDTPQEKQKTTAYKVYLSEEDRYIVCYLQSDSIKKNKFYPGEEFLFYGQIQAFRNIGNPKDFDYVKYMYNQGFVGSVYVPSQFIYKTGEISLSPKYTALRYRERILNFYKSLGFDNTEYSILSALTLGYQNELTEEVKQGFRTTGTVHVLSVSGLHVGIIYLMISFCLSFIPRGSKYYWIKPVIVIVLLWVYAFVTGLPPSVIRASAMLTVFCISELFGRKSFSVHALYITAFFMLLVNPFSLFDIGFQLSFISVLSILYLHPKVSGLFAIENKYMKTIWQAFTLSLVAQLATFPICLYYFGTFPTYFFAANLIIVPLVSLITYAMSGIILAKIFSLMLPDFSYYFYYLPVKCLQILVHMMTQAIHFFEGLPYALIDDLKISFIDLLLIFSIIFGFTLFLIYRKSQALIIGLFGVLLLFVVHTYNNLGNKSNTLMVYNKQQVLEVNWNCGSKEQIIRYEDVDNGYKFIQTGDISTLVLSTDVWNNKTTDEKFQIDNLVLMNDNNHSLYSLTQLFSVKNIILDASLSTYTRSRLSKECQKLNIPYHDVVEKGAFSSNF